MTQSRRKVFSAEVRRRARALERLRFVRYLAAAGVATLADIVLFALGTAYVLTAPLALGDGLVLHNETAVFVCTYSLGVVINFLISKYYVFPESNVRTRVQFTRFVAVALLIFGANFLVMKGFREVLPAFGTEGLLLLLNQAVLRGVPALVVAVFGFAVNKFFSFQV